LKKLSMENLEVCFARVLALLAVVPLVFDVIKLVRDLMGDDSPDGGREEGGV
jgi:hypothetical protein